ncbi:MAG TPA: L,D-transpeptidase [Fimbriiglobus sp.]|jgi:lipoprotein-anchoring transpeptidase ErfK/SrfK
MPKVTKIVVNLDNQTVDGFAGSDRLFHFDAVVGRPGHETTPGQYHILRHERMHYSKTYGNASMPYSMFFSSDGKAFHGTRLPWIRSVAGTLGLGALIPAVGSHGCVGLAEEDAKLLYDATPDNTQVEIVH